MVNYLHQINMLFSKKEYQDRLKKTQQSMQEKGLELLISQDTNNIKYLTGNYASSIYNAQSVIELVT